MTNILHSFLETSGQRFHYQEDQETTWLNSCHLRIHGELPFLPCQHPVSTQLTNNCHPNTKMQHRATSIWWNFAGDEDEGDVIKVIAKSRNTRVNFWYYDDFGRTEREVFTLQKGGHRTIMANRSTPVSIRVSTCISYIIKKNHNEYLQVNTNQLVVGNQANFSCSNLQVSTTRKPQ